MRYIIALILAIALLGCGGGGGESDNNSTSTQKKTTETTHSSTQSSANNPLSSADFTIDEHVFDDTSGFTKIKAKSRDVRVELVPQRDDSVLSIESSDIKGTADIAASHTFETTLDKDVFEDKIGKPLFIDEQFAGIIESFKDGIITVRDADSITEVYKKFDIQGAVDKIDDSMKESIKRSIRRSIGRYDALNKEPLKISFSSRETDSKNRSIASKEPVITIEFPKGYTMPLRSLTAHADCDVSEAMCDTSFNYNKKYEQSFDKEKTFGSVVFSTFGSKIEIGLGAFIRAMFDYNSIGDNDYYFEFKPSAYYMVNLQMSLTGTSIKGGDKTFEIIKNGLDISIPLGNKFVQLNLNIVPELVIGIEDAPNNKDVTFIVKVSSSRSGYVRLVYSSGGSSVTKGINEKSEPLDKSSVTFKVDTGDDKIVGYSFPEIAVRPQLSFTKIKEKVNIATVRNGVRFDTRFKGVVDDDWIVDNEDIYGSTVEDVYLKSYIYGLIDYKWDIKVGSIDIISADNWTEIYKSDSFKILEWYSQFLQQPSIKVESHDDKRFVSFDIKSRYKPYIRYYYTLNGDTIDSKTVNEGRDSTPYSIWRDGDEPIELSEDKTVKVRAVLFTDEIPEKQDSKWVWGMSISKEAEKDIVYIPEPELLPPFRDFSESVTVKVKQDEGDDIYISHDGVSFSKCGTESCIVTISKTEDFYAKTVRHFNNKEFFSSVVHGYYYKCGNGESIDSNGKCATECPYLWEVSYSEAGERHEGSEENDISYTTGIMRQRLFITPDHCIGDGYVMNETEYKLCEPYYNNIYLPPYYLNTSCYWPKGEHYRDSGGDGGISYLNIFQPNETLCETVPKEISMGGGENCIFGGNTTHDIDIQNEMAPHIIKREPFSLQTDHGVIHFEPLSYVKKELNNNTESNESNESGKAEETSIDNQSDNDEDNGEKVDGKLHEDINATTWKVEMTLDSTAWGKGSMNIEGIKIDCKNPTGVDDNFAGKSCGEAEYGENSDKFSFSGVLSHDDALLELAVMTKDIEINVVMPQYEKQQFHFNVNTFNDANSANDTFGCNAEFKDEYLQNFKTNNAFTITSDGSVNKCVLTFTPCKESVCTE